MKGFVSHCYDCGYVSEVFQDKAEAEAKSANHVIYAHHAFCFTEPADEVLGHKGDAGNDPALLKKYGVE